MWNYESWKKKKTHCAVGHLLASIAVHDGEVIAHGVS